MHAESSSLAKSSSTSPGTGVFLLLLVNLGVFLADAVFHVPAMKSLYLWHNAPHWWQFLTAAFCHANWEHISSNLFMLMVFGKVSLSLFL